MDKLLRAFGNFGREIDKLLAYYDDYRRADPKREYYEGAHDAIANVKQLALNLLEEIEEDGKDSGVYVQKPH